jgi:phage tail protein X
MQRLWAVVILAAIAPTVTIQPTQCMRQPAPAANLPAGYSVYRTEAVTTPYQMAERFYGHGYLAYKIVNANKSVLAANGTFPKGVDIVLPPDNEGRSVPERLLKEHKYY